MMREFLRGCLVWFLGYPISVVAATVVLTAPIWATDPAPFDKVMRMVGDAGPLVGFFALLPALLTPRSRSVQSYVAAGARTGAWCGLIAFSMYFVIGVAAVVGELAALLQGRPLPEFGPVLLSVIGLLLGAIAVFSAAGAMGGFVFGLLAAEPAPNTKP